jgi:small-conductance mechanosensitive channel
MKAKKLIPLLILLTGAALFIFSLTVRLFQYDWDPILRQRNDGGVFLLRVFYPILLLAFAAGYLMARANSKTWVNCGYIAVLVMVFYKVLEVYSV